MIWANKMKLSVEKVLPIASCAVTTATDHQTERTLSPGTCAPAKCNNQPGTRYSGVHPTLSSALSPARTLVSGLRLDYLQMYFQMTQEEYQLSRNRS